MARGDRAIGAYPVRLVLGHLAEHRAADLHRVLVVLLFHAPGAVVPRAALHRLYFRSRERFEHLARLLPHVLHARMTRDVIGDFAELLLEISLEEPVLSP